MLYGKSFYERKIKYLDYFEGQMRLGGGGFAKLEVREGNLRVDMTVTGLHVTDTFARDVVLCGKGRERVAGRIDIVKGRGQYQQQWHDLDDIGGTGIGYGELQGIRIPLGPGREVSCRWQETEMPVKTQPGVASAGGKRSGEGYVQEIAGTSGKSRSGRQIEEGAVEETYMEEKSAAERHIAEEDVVERYRIGENTGVGRTEEKDRETGYGKDGMEGGWQAEETEEGIGETPEKELSAGRFSEREVSERERAAADRWRIEEDAETGTISRESEIRAMEGGRGDMARASHGGEIRYSRERYEADGEINGAYGIDGSILGGHMGEGGRKKQKKDAYGTDEFRPGGYAAEKGIRVQENERYGMGGEKTVEGGNGYGDRKAVGSRTGNEDRRDVGSRAGNEDRRDVGSRTGNEDRRDVGSRTGNIDRMGAESGNRRDVESRAGYSDRRATESNKDHRRGEKSIEKQMKPMEDKWPQLWAIYPHIRPFQDEREYLSIGPADFVLFPASSYRTVNNSFLLHGYYNYKHLILARVEKRGEVFYYIGVPGNFYEREKQVAIMFGFESFECAEEPAQVGDFGYYMMRTEL